MSLSGRTAKVHFIGIGGIGMSGIAEVLIRLGYSVSGSDAQNSETTSRLTQMGAKIQIGHTKNFCEQIKPNVIVYSSAIKKENPEYAWAKEKHVPLISRAEMLGEIMRLKRGLAVAGSHGKTTTTGLVSLILKEAQLDPTVVIGGKFDAIGSNAAWGEGQWLVAEADESDGSFMRLSPELAIVTNIDREHLDHYGSFEEVKKIFFNFIDRIPFYGTAVLCSDCEHLFSLKDEVNKNTLWYGFNKEKSPDAWIEILEQNTVSRFKIYLKEDSGYKFWLEAKLCVPGKHNISNAVAAALTAKLLEVDKQQISQSLEKFKGVRRRFEVKGFWNQHPIIEDYAHHPTEIRATLDAAKQIYPTKPLIVCFQPHRYTRTRDQWAEFSKCFTGSNVVLSLPIYSASEPEEAWTKDYNYEKFSKNIVHVEKSIYCSSKEDMVSKLNELESQKLISLDSPVLILGAGDINKIIPNIKSHD